MWFSNNYQIECSAWCIDPETDFIEIDWKIGVEYVPYRKCDVILLEHFMSHWPQCKTITITITTQSNENRLLGSSDDWCGIAWDLVEQENGEALLQQFRGCCEQVTNGLPLLLAPCAWPGRLQLPQLHQPHLVPTNKRLCHIWDKFNSLLISCTPPPVFVGQGEGVAQKPGPCSCSLSGWVTITSNAAFLPPAHLGMNISAGLRLVPGSRARPSFRGARPAEAAESWIASLRSPCGQQVFLKYSVTCFQKSEVPPQVLLFFLTRFSGPSEIYICSMFIVWN